MRVRNARDLLAGLLFIAFGAAFLVAAQNYEPGSARRMGPGYFPVVLSLVLIGIGLATVARGWLVPGAPVRDVAGKALALVTAAIVLFGLLVQGAGLAAAVVALVLVSALASRRFRPLPSLVLALALAAFSIAVFVRGLGLQFREIGPWLGGG
jgi:putative tricarboxylic transport membrane protein